MAYKVSLLPKAYDDITNALEYYAEQGSLQALINFDKEIEIARKMISENPISGYATKTSRGFL